MIWLGLKKSTRGYGSAVNQFHRDGTPLSKKMREGLEAELAAAEAEIGRIRGAIAASRERVTRKQTTRRAKRGKTQVT